MKKFFSLMTIVILSVLAGCSSVDEIPLSGEDRHEPIVLGHVSREKACDILNKILLETSANFSNGLPNITSMACIDECRAYDAAGEELTRANEEEARFYVFNIGVEGDYAIMGAHTSIPPLLVLASGASPSESDGSDELKNAITNLPYNLSQLDSIGIADSEYIKCYDYENAEYTLLKGKTPLTYKWGPHAPWNTENGCLKPNPDNVTHYANNCSCIAMAMILTNEHYRPSSFNGESFPDWDLVSAYKYEGIQLDEFAPYDGLQAVVHLIHFLSQEKLMDVYEWDKWVSYNSVYSICPAFDSLGFKVDLFPYDLIEVSDCVAKGYPVFTLGQKLDGDDAGPYHSWVISGILDAKVPYRWVSSNNPTVPDPDFPTIVNYEYQTLVHHNWGWAGQGDGFYLDAIKIQSGQDVVLDDSYNVLRTVDKHHGWGLYGNLKYFRDRRVNL